MKYLIKKNNEKKKIFFFKLIILCIIILFYYLEIKSKYKVIVIQNYNLIKLLYNKININLYINI